MLEVRFDEKILDGTADPEAITRAEKIRALSSQGVENWDAVIKPRKRGRR